MLSAIEDHRERQPPTPGDAKILVTRRSRRVLYRELEQIEYRALDASRDGATFAEICAMVAADADSASADPVTTINRLLARWLAYGVFIRAD